MANRPNEFPIFTNFEASEMEKLIGDVVPQLLRNMTNILGAESVSEISVDYDIMADIITRVEKRRVYFYIYHNGLQMGELNEGALYCFWILKLVPFKHPKISNSTLNTKIACTFFVNLLYYVAKSTGKHININKLLMNNLLYAFKYRDLSKEAIMALAESLLSGS